MKTDYYNLNHIDYLPDISGIYWLFKSSNGILDLVYLGKSGNLRQRLRQHKTKGWEFDSFTYGLYPERLLEKIEKEMLSDYFQRFYRLPKYNKQLG